MRVLDRPLALVGGTVLTMDAAGVLPSATVVVADGRVGAVDPRLPADRLGDAEVLDCTGRFVLPGLADLHAHVSSRQQWPLWLAHGITTVRDMWGSPMQLAWRADVASGTAVGPRLVCASPYLDGPLPDGSPRYPGVEPVPDADAAVRAAQAHVGAGYDALKVYSGLAPDALAAVGEVARSARLPVLGHCPQGMAIEAAVAAGLRGVEHLVEWPTGHLAGPEPLPADLPRRVREVDERLDRGSLSRLADVLLGAGAHVTPTLTVWSHLADTAADHASDPALQHMPAAARARWARAGIRPRADGSAAELRSAVARQRDQVAELTAMLFGRGVPVCVGTDAGSIWTVPGWSMTEELHLLSAAGLGPDAVLRAATAGAAAAVGQQSLWGRVAPGYAADLLVLAEDPRVDVRRATRPDLVVTGGRLHTRESLDEALRSRVATVDGEPALPREQLAPMGRPEWWDR